MPYTATQLQTLIDVRASGTLRVTYADGKSVQYQTGADLDAAIAQAKRDVAESEAAAIGSSPVTRQYGEYTRG